jgi:NADH:ubiquinone oxidoreductase subunit 2 (subunit N)
MLITELMMFQALIAKNYWWLAAIILILVLVIIYGLAVRLLGVLFLKRPITHINIHGATAYESVIQLMLILLVFYIGLFRPDFIVTNIQHAISALPL